MLLRAFHSVCDGFAVSLENYSKNGFPKLNATQLGEFLGFFADAGVHLAYRLLVVQLWVATYVCDFSHPPFALLRQ